MMQKFWSLFNIANGLAIVLVVYYSEDVVFWLNDYRDYLNSKDELSDAMHAVRLIINKWEGIAMAGTLALLFFLRKVSDVFTGLVSKITSR